VKDPQIAISYSATETSFEATGDQLHYSIEVRNTGNLTVAGLTLASTGDLAISGSAITSLAPGETTNYTGVHTVSQADLEAGKVVRAINATGSTPDRQSVHAFGNELTITGVQYPELSTVASSVETVYSLVGEVIHYNILVRNSGNVSIISTAVTDPNAVIISARPNTILLPGETFTVLANHTVTQADLDAGEIVSVATSTGFDLQGNTIEKKGNPVTVLAIQRREMSIENSSVQPLFRNVGEVVNYNLVVTNTGNITLYTIELADPTILLNNLTPLASLLPGKAYSLTGSHIITQEDMDAGKVISIVTAKGLDINGKSVENSSNKVTIFGNQRPDMMARTATSDSTYNSVGQVIRYSVVIRNTGNVTMNDIHVTDAKVLLDFSNTIASLAPGATDSLVAEHRVTLADINAGKIVTAGIAHGTSLASGESSYISNPVTVRLSIDNYNLNNFPNPFAYETTISFDLPAKGEVILKVLDVTGREVGEIDRKEFNQGRNFVNWRTYDMQKGMYILKLYYNGNQAIRMISIMN
jgi:hypothetical protein